MRYQAPETTLLMIVSDTHVVPDTAHEVVHHSRVDVYSYGLLLYEITHGNIAFDECTPIMAAQKSMEGERPPLVLYPEHKPLGALIEECWHAQPDRRPDMETVVKALSALA